MIISMQKEDLCSKFDIPYYSIIQLLPQTQDQQPLNVLIDRSNSNDLILKQVPYRIIGNNLAGPQFPWIMKIDYVLNYIDLVCDDAIVTFRGRGLGSYLFNNVMKIATQSQFKNFKVKTLKWSYVDEQNDPENVLRRKRFYSRFGIEFFATNNNTTITVQSDSLLRCGQLRTLPPNHLIYKVKEIAVSHICFPEGPHEWVEKILLSNQK